MKAYFKHKLTKIFGNQCKKIIKKHSITVVAVAGSVGKTSTKLAIAKTLSAKYRVLYQEGNYNVPISVPFIFLGRQMPALLNPFGWFFAWIAGQKILHGNYPYDVVVIELGTDYPGELSQFAAYLSPDITVITAVAEEHMEFFKTIDAVAKEELSVAEFSKTLLINADDINEEYLEKYLPKNTEIHSYGFEHVEYKATLNDSRLSINLGGDSTVSVTPYAQASHVAKVYTAAAAVADLLDLTDEQISQGLQKISAPAGRMQRLQGINNSIIIDDTYNSSPKSATAALGYLYDQSSPYKIAILGSMNELGDSSEASHRAVGKLCDPKKLDLLITIGDHANNYLAEEAIKNKCRVITCDSPYQAGRKAKENIAKNSVILVKGSQNRVFSEEAIKVLLLDQADVNKLVRQSPSWLAKKQKQFPDSTQ
jgi:UDP-N-acetylmuramoyl-tripeptide--D-alanyl-D-alanine ligase